MKLTITLISILFSTALLFGQIVDKTEQRAKNKTNQRIDNKIDNGIDKGLDAVEGLFSKKKKSNDKQSTDDDYSEQSQNSTNSSDTQSAMSMFGGKADVEDSYDFDHNMLLNIDTYNKKGKQQDPMDMRMYFSDDKPNFGMEIEMEGSKSFIIYDMKSYQMVSLIENDGQKIGTAMKFNPEKFEENVKKASEDNSDVTYKFIKTGNSKVISGYNCDEYKMESSESDPEWDQTFWVTDEMDANWMENMSKMASSNKMMAQKFEIPEGYPEGTMIQIISESNKNQEKSIMTVKEYNNNQEKSFSTTGYQFMNIPGMGGN
ncbi:hypothetical protein G3O08_18910 [Cryomorpha ignava]|uniref:DUF4412 domain-containing protein n=1 Tax=Cryomorpha ignava TaxID=101383 RepID=A0A7K3WV77_9FLAO|nr:hypothetical protein [Cryomorpha ignava]NEN25567.1 hypothetical protein [Cryomorpha ignava]